MSTDPRILIPDTGTADLHRSLYRSDTDADWTPSPRFAGPIDPARVVPRADLKPQHRHEGGPVNRVPRGAATGYVRSLIVPRQPAPGAPAPAPKRPPVIERVRALLRAHVETHPGAGLTNPEIAAAAACSTDAARCARNDIGGVERRTLARRVGPSETWGGTGRNPGTWRVEYRLAQPTPWPAPADGWYVAGGGA